mmetsp:Transcript_73640/g.157988  ORF Transcript_73640/g.157988 Transcript_73640/m.157988 type:complete len:557 (+) Transcript_73640:72-1742(+)
MAAAAVALPWAVASNICCERCPDSHGLSADVTLSFTVRLPGGALAAALAGTPWQPEPQEEHEPYSFAAGGAASPAVWPEAAPAAPSSPPQRPSPDRTLVANPSVSVVASPILPADEDGGRLCSTPPARVAVPLRAPSSSPAHRGGDEISPEPEVAFLAEAGEQGSSGFDPFEQLDAERASPSGRSRSGSRTRLAGVATRFQPFSTIRTGTAVDNEGSVAEDAIAPLHPQPRQRELAVLRGHSSCVSAVAWSPDGSRLATASTRHTLCIWQDSGPEIWQWEPLKTLRLPTDGFTSLAWCPEGTGLAAGSMDRTVRVWQAPEYLDGDPRRWEAASVLKGHSEGVRAVAWARETRRLLSGSDDSTARVWQPCLHDPWEWELAATLRGHDGGVRAVAWSHSGSKAATGGQDGTCCVWFLDDALEDHWCLMATLRSHIAGLRAVAWSPDDAFLATASEDRTVLLSACDASEPAQWYVAETLRGHSDTVRAVAWSPDGTQICTGGDEGAVCIWAAPDAEGATSCWELRKTLLGHSQRVHSVAWSPDGERLLTGGADRTVRLW